MRPWMKSWAQTIVVFNLSIGTCLFVGAQTLGPSPALPVLDQFNRNIDNNGAKFKLDGDWQIQQGVRAGRTGVLTGVRLHLGAGEYNVRVFPGRPWVWSEAAEVEGYAIQVVETSWVSVATSLALTVGDYYTIEVSGIGAVGETNHYNPPKGYTVPYDGYPYGYEWGHHPSWRCPAIMGCVGEGETFDIKFEAWGHWV